MTDLSFVLLYVASPTESAMFYGRLLGQQPAEASPGFAMFVLPSGMKLGLWARHDVQPPATATGGGGELCFTVPTPHAVHETYAQWVAQGVPIVQTPVQMDFGYTFTAVDPDGHRLRVFAPSQE